MVTFNFLAITIFLFFYQWQTGAVTRKITILSPGFFGFDAFPSLSYNGPAIETGVQRLRLSYPQFNWTSKYLHTEEMSSCIAVFDNIQNVLSRWYYTERDPDSLSLIVAPGTLTIIPLVGFNRISGYNSPEVHLSTST
jgi:hypothetical protein